MHQCITGWLHLSTLKICNSSGTLTNYPFYLLASLFFQKVLAAHGAAKVSAYVTHGVFPKRSWERFTHKNEGKDLHVIRHTYPDLFLCIFQLNLLTLSHMMIVPFFFSRHGGCICLFLDNRFLPSHCESHHK
jgi:hypothetical protein